MRLVAFTAKKLFPQFNTLAKNLLGRCEGGTYKCGTKIDISEEEEDIDGKLSFLRVMIKHLQNCKVMKEDET